jgi:hypothetical protein
MSVFVGSFLKKADGTGAQAVTGTGFTPKALIMWTMGGVTAGTTRNSFYTAFGVSAGAANSKSVAAASLNAAAAANASRRLANKALTFVEWGEATIAECDLTSFDSNGFTLNWTTNDANAFVIHYMALGGAALTDAEVVDWTCPTSAIAQPVTGVGFAPDVVIHCYAGAVTSVLPVSAASAAFGVGVASAEGAQFSTSAFVVDAATTMDTQRTQSASSSIIMVNSTPAVATAAAHTSMDADGFTSTFSTGTSANRVITLCLKGGSYKAGSVTKSGSPTNTQDSAALGFNPNGVLLIGVHDALQSDAYYTVGASDGTRHQTGAFRDESGVADSVVVALDKTDKAFIGVSNIDGAFDAEATVVLGADKFTLNWSPNNSNTDSIGYLAMFIANDTGGGKGSGGKGKGGNTPNPGPPPKKPLRTSLSKSWKWDRGWR